MGRQCESSFLIDLVRTARRGRFDPLYFHLYNAVFTLAYRLVPQAVDDATQEAMVMIWRAVVGGKVDEERPILPFLLKIARNRMVSVARDVAVRRRPDLLGDMDTSLEARNGNQETDFSPLLSEYVEVMKKEGCEFKGMHARMARLHGTSRSTACVHFWREAAQYVSTEQ